MKKISVTFTLLILTFSFAQIKVATTIGMIADVVENVAANCFEVTTMMGPGVDPHLYKASASDVRTLQTADIIFYSGYHLEGQLGEILDRFERNKTVVAVTEEAIDEAFLLKVNNSSVDPHLWMDVSLWAKTIEVITKILIEFDNECAEDIQAKSIEYKNVLEDLHKWVKTSIANIPEEQRVLVTAHDAFGYYGEAYNIEVASIQGISTQSEASLADIRNTVDLVANSQIPALFVESSINPATIEAVLAAARDRGVEVSLGGQLFSDAMGERGKPEGTYIGMIFSNTKTITEALGGEIAELPESLCYLLEHSEN